MAKFFDEVRGSIIGVVLYDFARRMSTEGSSRRWLECRQVVKMRRGVDGWVGMGDGGCLPENDRRGSDRGRVAAGWQIRHNDILVPCIFPVPTNQSIVDPGREAVDECILEQVLSRSPADGPSAVTLSNMYTVACTPDFSTGTAR